MTSCWRGVAGLALAILGLAAIACSSAGGRTVDRAAPSAAEGSPRADAARQVLVVLPPPAHRWPQVAAELGRIHNLQQLAAWEMESLGELCAVYRVPSYTTPEEMAERLSGDPRIRLAQPNHRFRVQSSSGAEQPAAPAGRGRNAPDPYLELQHAARTLHLAEAHRRATGRGVTVALVDTGVDVDHPDLRGRVAGAGDFVDQGAGGFTSDVHGTAVAGVVAAAAGNGTGIVGVAPDARLLALKACWPDPPGSRTAACTSYTLAQALDAAIGSDARVLTLSLTGPDDPLLGALVERALEGGVVVVAAVDPEVPDGGFPAHLHGVLAPWPAAPEEGTPSPAVATAVRAGPAQALRAPSVEILTTIPRGAYDFFSGTSFAAAHAAGVAALVLELRPRATPTDIATLLERTARSTRTVPAASSPGPTATASDPPGNPIPEPPPQRLLDAAAAVAAAAPPG